MGQHRYCDCSIKARQGETACKGRAIQIGGFVANQLTSGDWRGPARLEDVIATKVGRSNRNSAASSHHRLGPLSTDRLHRRRSVGCPAGTVLIEWGISNQSPLKFVVEASFCRWTLASFANL